MSKKKGYRDLKNNIIELESILSARNGRIAVLCLANASKDDKIQEYKKMIKSLEYKIRIVSDAVSEPTKRKVFKIPLRTETKYDKQHKKNCTNPICDTYFNVKNSLIDDTEAFESLLSKFSHRTRILIKKIES